MATKRKAAAKAGISGFCKVLSNGIKDLQKAIRDDRKAIADQKSFIQQLIKQGAKPAIVAQAKDRLTMLEDKLESDEAQLSAFQDEFAASCRP